MLQLIVIGNSGKDAEMRFTPSGQPVASFDVASTRKYARADGTPVKETTWVRVSVWGKLAEICAQYVKKGKKVCVVGRLNPDANGNPRTFQRNDGSTGASFEMTADSVEFLSAADHGEEAPEAAQEEQIPL
jgi:single-strand DNA-binding protein